MLEPLSWFVEYTKSLKCNLIFESRINQKFDRKEYV